MADFSILLICKFRQYKVVNIANFVYYGTIELVVADKQAIISVTRPI